MIYERLRCRPPERSRPRLYTGIRGVYRPRVAVSLPERDVARGQIEQRGVSPACNQPVVRSGRLQRAGEISQTGICPRCGKLGRSLPQHERLGCAYDERTRPRGSGASRECVHVRVVDIGGLRHAADLRGARYHVACRGARGGPRHRSLLRGNARHRHVADAVDIGKMRRPG